MAFEFDLLGDPITDETPRRGRPEHQPSDEKRRLVIQLLAFDWSMEKIAAALNCTPPTLRKHYFRELKLRAEARARVEAQLLGSLMDEARAGNAGAIEKYFKRLDRHDLGGRAAQPKAQKKARLGKKEAALVDAQDAHKETSWEELVAEAEQPKLLN